MSATRGSAPNEDTAAPLPAGHVLNKRYEIVRPLGSGGFGTVYLARDRLLQRDVALKVPRSGILTSPNVWKKLLDEARVAARLSHPAIVKVHDFGTDESSEAFIVLEFIDGPALSSLLRQERLDLAWVVDLVIQVAEAIHCGHKAGLVHRDLKPGNILLDTQRRPHVSDFGLAVDQKSQLDLAGEVAGSPAYMSPEQVRGETHFLDGRTDIWSLGVLLHELITGERPFQGNTWRQMFDQIEKREPRPLRQFDEHIPERLQQLCLRCLSKDIADRPSSAADVASELRTIRSSLPSVDSKARVAPAPLWNARSLGLAIGLGLMALAIGWFAFSGLGGNPGQLGQPVVPAVTPENTGPEAWPKSLSKGKWHNLLQYRPETVSWPLDPRLAFWNVDPNSHELRLQCQGDGALAFGEVAAPQYTVRMNMHQPNWPGGLGLMLGAHKESVDGTPTRSYQIVKLVQRGQPSGDQYALDLLNVTNCGAGDDASHSVDGWLSKPIPSPAPHDQMLEVQVREGALHKVSWNRKPIMLVGVLQTPDTKSKAVVAPGMIGVYCGSSAGTIRQLEILVLADESNGE